MNWFRKLSVGLVGMLILTLVVSSIGLAAGENIWPSAGQDLNNTRNQSEESKISPANAGNLAVKWKFTPGGDISATPAVDSNTVYIPDWAGNLFALDAKTGAAVWSRKVADITGVPGDLTRTTPAINGNTLIFGNQGGINNGSGAYLVAVSKKDGSLLWKTQVDAHPAAVVTQSAVVNDGVVYVGVSSLEEAFAADPSYTCCSFRGSLVALNAKTGAILWKTYTVPNIPGYSGGAVWGSTPVVDPSRKTVFITTGNNYSVPAAVETCAANASTPAQVRACFDPSDHFDSVMALDMRTGAIRWATAAMPYDAWNVSCFFGATGNCPQPAGPDYDFGQGASLFSVKDGKGKKRDLLGAGQKSGQYWTFDPDTGAVVWVTQAAPGGTAGGLQWGSAVDGRRIYFSATNSEGKPWTLPSGATVNSGVIGALDAATGRILWEIGDPQGARDGGAVSVANGVVYACSLDPAGHMYSLNAATGAILKDFASGGSCNAGAAVSKGVVYWGSGYSRFGFGTPNQAFYAFGLP
jgi:polyvinyl alcohol dehydrogenase (cytochrome)